MDRGDLVRDKIQQNFHEDQVPIILDYNIQCKKVEKIIQ